MKKSIILLVSLLFAISLSSCASIIDGTTQEVSFNSEPQDVEVTIDGKVIGKTPVAIQLDKKSGRTVVFSLEGYKPQTRSLETTVNPWFFGNIITGGLIGSSTDATSGAMYEYSPGQYYITMATVSSSSVNSIKSDNAKIKEFIVVSYKQIIIDLAQGEGEYLDSLVSMLKIEDSSRPQSIEKIKSLSETYNIIPEFAEEVVNYFMK